MLIYVQLPSLQSDIDADPASDILLSGHIVHSLTYSLSLYVLRGHSEHSFSSVLYFPLPQTSEVNLCSKVTRNHKAYS